MDEANPDFSIGLFDVGDSRDCMYSYFCTCCALAEARTNLDDSPFWFNVICLPLAPFRWLTRSAYRIGNLDSAIDDILYSTFLPCCVVNQLYQTTKKYGKFSSDGGKEYNVNSFHANTDRSCDEVCSHCCLYPCAVGNALEHSIGMPYYLGCCCMNIFAARNIIRYQYRLKPLFEDDIYDELLIPILYVFGGFALCNPIIGFSMQLAISVQLFREVKMYPKTEIRGYLWGYQCEYNIPVLSLDAIHIADSSLHSNESLDNLQEQSTFNNMNKSSGPQGPNKMTVITHDMTSLDQFNDSHQLDTTYISSINNETDMMTQRDEDFSTYIRDVSHAVHTNQSNIQIEETKNDTSEPLSYSYTQQSFNSEDTYNNTTTNTPSTLHEYSNINEVSLTPRSHHSPMNETNTTILTTTPDRSMAAAAAAVPSLPSIPPSIDSSTNTTTTNTTINIGTSTTTNADTINPTSNSNSSGNTSNNNDSHNIFARFNTSRVHMFNSWSTPRSPRNHHPLPDHNILPSQSNPPHSEIPSTDMQVDTSGGVHREDDHGDDGDHIVHTSRSQNSRNSEHTESSSISPVSPMSPIRSPRHKSKITVISKPIEVQPIIISANDVSPYRSSRRVRSTRSELPFE